MLGSFGTSRKWTVALRARNRPHVQMLKIIDGNLLPAGTQIDSHINTIIGYNTIVKFLFSDSALTFNNAVLTPDATVLLSSTLDSRS